MELPRLVQVRQLFRDDALADPAGTVRAELERIGAAAWFRPGKRVAIAVGSRGIDRYPEIVGAAAQLAREGGSVPVVVPAMGSHAGGTAESQSDILVEQGIGVPGFPAPIDSSTGTVSLGASELGDEVRFDEVAAASDVLLVINRVKAHTDFEAPVESGLAKMLVVGLGKPKGAQQAHRSFRRHGFYPALTAGVRLILGRVPVIVGIAIVENESHRCMKIEAIPGHEILEREPALLRLSKSRMAGLPVRTLDLLVVEEIGKNISGSGMDTNVISRKQDPSGNSPAGGTRIEYIYVRQLAEESHGNAVGIGLADFCGEQVVRTIDLDTTYLNCLTSGTPRGAAIPVHLGSDRLTFEAVVNSLPLSSPGDLRVAWIRNTLALEEFYVSEPLLPEFREGAAVEPVGHANPIVFDAAGNLSSPYSR